MNNHGSEDFWQWGPRVTSPLRILVQTGDYKDFHGKRQPGPELLSVDSLTTLHHHQGKVTGDWQVTSR